MQLAGNVEKIILRSSIFPSAAFVLDRFIATGAASRVRVNRFFLRNIEKFLVVRKSRRSSASLQFSRSC